MKKNIVILISGNGTNLQAIIDAVEAGSIDANIALVISNREEAYGLKRAEKANIKTLVIKNGDFANRESYDAKLIEAIVPYHPTLIILAGFMRILSDHFVEHFDGKILNIHPALLPKYKGLNTHAKVLSAGDKIHGVTVHYVTNELDGGPIIEQAECEILEDDTVESLEARIHQLEHKLYPKVIAQLLETSTL